MTGPQTWWGGGRRTGWGVLDYGATIDGMESKCAIETGKIKLDGQKDRYMDGEIDWWMGGE